ncbi:TPA_inf: Endo-type membrane-bound lytic murein transglycosylase A [Marinomonas phage YY]|nr:TPA_inf: Endo-type membrane-bound lytic murein transglycosylase A [Marinomonas phage YY]
MILRLVLLGALGLLAWREFGPDAAQAALSSDPETPDEAQGLSVLEQMFPELSRTSVELNTKEHNLLRDHWQYVQPWARANLEFTAALMWQESRGNPAAVSGAGALGLMQVMPGTGQDIYDRLGYQMFPITRENMLRPDVSIYLGTAYLEWLATQNQTTGYEWIARAYNGGAGNATARMGGGRNVENDGHWNAISGRMDVYETMKG